MQSTVEAGINDENTLRYQLTTRKWTQTGCWKTDQVMETGRSSSLGKATRETTMYQ